MLIFGADRLAPSKIKLVQKGFVTVNALPRPDFFKFRHYQSRIACGSFTSDAPYILKSWCSCISPRTDSITYLSCSIRGVGLYTKTGYSGRAKESCFRYSQPSKSQLFAKPATNVWFYVEKAYIYRLDLIPIFIFIPNYFHKFINLSVVFTFYLRFACRHQQVLTKSKKHDTSSWAKI